MTDIMDIDPAQMKPRKVTKKKRVKRVLIHLFFKLNLLYSFDSFHNPHPIISDCRITSTQMDCILFLYSLSMTWFLV